MARVKLPGIAPDTPPQIRVRHQALAPGAAAVNSDEPQHIASRQSAIQRGEQQTAQILDARALWQPVVDLDAMQIDQMQFQRIARHPVGPTPVFDQKMAQIKIAMIHARAVESAGNPGNLQEQCALEQFLPGALEPTPVAREILEMDHVIERFGDEKGFLVRRRVATLSLAGHAGGGNSQAFHAFQGLPFRAGTDHRRAALEPVLPNFAPAAGAVDLDEKTAAANLGFDRAAMLDVPMDLAGTIQHPVEGVFLGQVLLQMGTQFKHLEMARSFSRAWTLR